MERKERESERMRVDVTRKCAEMGYRRTRYLSLDEGREFLASGRIPADALSSRTFVNAKSLDALPSGSFCLCCGKDLSGGHGYVVETATPDGKTFRTICPVDYDAIANGNADRATAKETAGDEPQTADAPVAVEPPPPPPAPASAAAPNTDIATALKTLTDALSTPKPAPFDKAEILAEVQGIARAAATDEARAFMQKSVADYIRDGAVPAADDASDDAPELAAATCDGVAAVASASGWKAKATPKAAAAVDKLQKFLSEFSYFREGASMRFINSFARAKDKKAALQAYCEVSQMEDMPDLVEKMKSAEFAEVVKAFDGFAPEAVNRRFAVFYGQPGGGKTYAAVKACERINGGACAVVPCSPSMDAADMLYAYRLDYKTGRRGYVPTALLTAMVAGRAVVLDEVNLLPMEARMFLQNILDNKDRVSVMGTEIAIRDGFFVIGTMNLETGLGASPLPLPLVDRAAVVRKFTTTTAQAAVGAGLC